MNPDLPPQNLDQSEIDRLLAQAASEQKPRARLLRANGDHADDDKELRAETYDFRNPAFLSELELRRLRILQEDFIRYLAARLSLFLRMEIGLKMAKLTTVSYSKFTESLPSPTHLCLFKAEPLVGIGIIDVNPRLALSMADRLLGGRGHSVKAERYLTEIEIALLEDVILIVLEEWCNQWKSEQELRPLLIGHENNGRFLQTSPKDAVVLALSIEATFGDCSEQIQIGVPYYTIEPLVRSMQARRQRDSAVSHIEKRSSWQPGYAQIEVPVRADWEAFELPLREIAALRVGDVIELPAHLIEQTRVLINGTPLFRGTAGLDTGRIAVQLSARLPASPPQTTHSDGRKIA
ncbi:MAG TPA: FliM/FliN family flagellar motor switch protein [Opitutus sp.]|nr:FliM/FliN family flagellar motor switch protein [Opitutus sp.]